MVLNVNMIVISFNLDHFLKVTNASNVAKTMNDSEKKNVKRDNRYFFNYE